ncbi:outer membrane beta-barrel protein, partial [Streptomyces galilaeus]|uniref:outer membrane beta-barrel protein n=1 Tax=Streptomyces galilaeus TaxID=33899 RepID=UPI0038F69978
FGAKTSFVKTNNTFDFYNVQGASDIKILNKSNSFLYKENVNAAYVNFQKQLNTKWSLQVGIRIEQTNSHGILTRADSIKQADDDVPRDYL